MAKKRTRSSNNATIADLKRQLAELQAKNIQLLKEKEELIQQNKKLVQQNIELLKINEELLDKGTGARRKPKPKKQLLQYIYKQKQKLPIEAYEALLNKAYENPRSASQIVRRLKETRGKKRQERIEKLIDKPEIPRTQYKIPRQRSKKIPFKTHKQNAEDIVKKHLDNDPSIPKEAKEQIDRVYRKREFRKARNRGMPVDSSDNIFESGENDDRDEELEVISKEEEEHIISKPKPVVSIHNKFDDVNNLEELWDSKLNYLTIDELISLSYEFGIEKGIRKNIIEAYINDKLARLRKSKIRKTKVIK